MRSDVQQPIGERDQRARGPLKAGVGRQGHVDGSNVDAIVFVADGLSDRQDANRASYEALEADLSARDLALAAVPHLVCVTKCDLENAEEADLSRRGKNFGWGRKDVDSVLRSD
jgi:hypothetical protein